jgi:hypothetical protein
MKRINLWSVQERDGSLRAVGLDEVANTETENHLEELLVGSPDLLLPGLVLIGRQLPTEGGPLDLLGVDQDGRLVVFELKRGTLTRDAVAQVLDYASDLAEKGFEEVARLVEKHSGHRGIQAIQDFSDWFGREFPDANASDDGGPRMVLVGLGADDRARRMVDFLVGTGVDIQLLTFQAFSAEGRLFLARQVESQSPPTKVTGGSSKEDNRRSLMALAREHEVEELLVEVGDYINQLLPWYRWPAKTAYSFSLQERTEEGRPTLRSYLTLWVNTTHKGHLTVTLPPRALEAAPEAMEGFLARARGATRTDSDWMPVQVEFDRTAWTDSVRAELTSLTEAVGQGWKSKLRKSEHAEVEDEEGD